LKNDEEKGTPVAFIAAKLRRSNKFIEARVGKMRLKRNLPLVNTRDVKDPTTFKRPPLRELLKKIDVVIFQFIDTRRGMKKKL